MLGLLGTYVVSFSKEISMSRNVSMIKDMFDRVFTLVITMSTETKPFLSR